MQLRVGLNSAIEQSIYTIVSIAQPKAAFSVPGNSKHVFEVRYFRQEIRPLFSMLENGYPHPGGENQIAGGIFIETEDGGVAISSIKIQTKPTTGEELILRRRDFNDSILTAPDPCF